MATLELLLQRLAHWTEDITPAISPITYHLKDAADEDVLTLSFYEQELKKITNSHAVEKISKNAIYKRIEGNILFFLISYRGYPAKFNSWVDAKRVKVLKHMAIKPTYKIYRVVMIQQRRKKKTMCKHNCGKRIQKSIFESENFPCGVHAELVKISRILRPKHKLKQSSI